jgi:integrase
MPLPAGLKYRDRIAKGTDGRYYVLCQRQPHPRTLRMFRHLKDARAWRTEHDYGHHTARGAATIAPVEERLETLCDDYLAHIEALVDRGKRDRQTAQHYRYCLRYIKAGLAWLGVSCPSDVTQDRISGYVAWRWEQPGHPHNGCKTEGARIVKELKALITVLRWESIVITFRVPIDEIGAVHAERVHQPTETIKAFLQAMPCDSVEYAFALLKIRSGIRNRELHLLHVSDIERETGIVNFTLRNKKHPVAHRIVLTDHTLSILAPHMAGKSPDDYLFTVRGRPLGPRTLTERFRKASIRAGINPPITAIGSFRHVALTLAANSLGVAAVSRAVGHRSEQTTQGYMLDDGSLEIKRRVAQILEEALPV